MGGMAVLFASWIGLRLGEKLVTILSARIGKRRWLRYVIRWGYR